MKLSGKVALVTGSGKGIGRAIALTLAEEGADVAINALHLESAEGAADEARRLGRKAIAIEADVAEVEDIDRMVAKTLEELGRIDILVNAAGILNEIVPTLEQSLENFDRVVSTHLRGTYLCCRQAGRWMIEHGGGKIINISSLAGMTGFPMRTAYGAAKAGIINLTKTLAIEWVKHNINVNCIAPGFTLTPRMKYLISEGIINAESLKSRIPLGRLGEPSEMARPALFLASDDARYITGVTIPVDGGWLAYGYYQQ